MLNKLIKSNRFWMFFTIIGGIVSIFGIVSHKLIEPIPGNIDMIYGFLSSIGFVFMIFGILKLIENKKMTPEKLKQKEIELKDERNIKILQISYSIGNKVATILFGTMSFIFLLFNYLIPALIAFGAMIIQIIVLLIAYRYYSKKI